MSLSAADTRWTDLLRMLAKLNDGIEYSEKELDSMTWQEKTKLGQTDPVTCSRYFEHRVQEFLNTILKSDCEPIGKVKDGPRQANLVLIAFASSEGSGEPAHPRSLARTFTARSYKQ